MHTRLRLTIFYSILLLLVFSVKLSGNFNILYKTELAPLTADLTNNPDTADGKNDSPVKEVTELNNSLTINYFNPFYANALSSTPGFALARLLTGHVTIIVQPPRKVYLPF